MDKNLVFEKLFNRSSGDSANKDFLEKIAGQHPYFSPAHFFLLQQLSPQSSSYDKQAAKTSLLFNNPYWLNFQLSRATSTVMPNDISALTPAADTAAIPENTGNNDDEVIIQNETDQMATATQLMPPIEQQLQDSPGPAEQEPALMPENADNDDDEVIIQNETEQMIAPLKEQPASLGTGAMLFEPMHMVDYFASQGIKLSEEAQSADKLGKQLKSFTEWLKTMKKIHPATGLTGVQAAEPTDKNIQQLAEKSNAEDEILTESMAEVFARQGKNGRAMEVYEKLSLLNPSKSAYFAAKIEYLKGI